MEYGGPQPGYSPAPSMMGYTAGALGYRGMTLQQRQQAVSGGGMSLGASALNFGTSTVPGLALAGANLAGVAGSFLEIGGKSALTRGFGRALNFADPTSFVAEAGMAGAGVGWGMGTSMGGALGMGTVGSYGMGIAGGAAGAVGLAAPFAAMAYGGYKAGQFALNNIWQGGQNYMAGQGMANSMGGTVAPGQSMMGQGASMGRMINDISGSTGMGVDDISRVAKELDAQKLFQTTRDMKEFRDKFSTAMKAVKEIASITKSSLDDAVKMFGDLRSQGFYNTADVKSQAAVTQARAAITGLGVDTMNAVGGAGSQMARQHGLRGKYGSDLAQRNVAGVSAGVRSGAISEEDVMEMGGVEAVGLRQSQQQMSFLSTSRGRAVIASVMGKDGAPDQQRLQSLLGGNMSLEGLVTSAAGRGLGVLGQAGSKESKEAMLPYAGMAMVQMAMMQQQQIYGSSSKAGTIKMLGTMGMSREEAEALLGNLGQLPDQMRHERQEGQNQNDLLASEARIKRRSFAGQIDSATANGRDYFQGMGSDAMQFFEGNYRRGMQGLSGGRTFRGGGDDIYKRALANGRSLVTRGDNDADTLLGGGATQDLRETYRTLGRTAEQLGLSPEEIAKRTGAGGDLIDLGSDGVDLGKLTSGLYLGVSAYVDLGKGEKYQNAITFDNRYVSRKAVEETTAAARRGASGPLDEATQVRLDAFLGNDKSYTRMQAAMEKDLGYGYVGSNVVKGLGIIGIKGEAAADSKMLEENFAAYYMAQQAGIISKDTSYESFMRDEPKRAEVQASMQKVAGGKNTPMSRALGTNNAANGLGAYTIEGARAARGTAISQHLSQLGSRGTEGNKALGERLTTDPEIQSLYVKFGEAVGKAVGGDIQALKDLNAIKDSLVRALGEDSPEGKEIIAQYSRAQDSAAYAKTLSKGIEHLDVAFQEGAIADHYMGLQRQGEAAYDAVAKTDKVTKEQLSLISNVNTATGKGSPADRKAAMQALMESFAADSYLSDEERVVIRDISEGNDSGGYGDAVAGVLEHGAAGLGKKIGKTLTKEQRARLDGKDINDRLKVLEELGFRPDQETSTKGEESIEGSEGDYKKANQEFIQTVAKFVTSTNKILGIGPEEGEGGEVGPQQPKKPGWFL